MHKKGQEKRKNFKILLKDSILSVINWCLSTFCLCINIVFISFSVEILINWFCLLLIFGQGFWNTLTSKAEVSERHSLIQWPPLNEITLGVKSEKSENYDLLCMSQWDHQYLIPLSNWLYYTYVIQLSGGHHNRTVATRDFLIQSTDIARIKLMLR